MQAFREYLGPELDRITEREGLSLSKAFLLWFATTVLELTDDEAREAISVEGANDKGIDLFWVDNDEGRVVVVQAKYSRALNYRAQIADVAKLSSSLNWLANPQALKRDGRQDLAQAAEDYLAAVNEGYGTELWYVYTGRKCPNADKDIAVFNQNSDNLDKRRAMRHYHLGLLVSAWQELQGGQSRIAKETIAIVNGEKLEFSGQFGRSLVATVPASELVRLYGKYEDRLFDRNVRLFLGMRKGSVNAGIAETLGDKSERGNFWAYNNGVTFICDSFSDSGSSVKVSNFSIVNGCQTTVSLAQKLSEEDRRVCILARFIAASASIVDDVIRFTNSQNPIRSWDIASQDKVQRRLKREFDKLQKPYIYLTRRGDRPKGQLSRYRDHGKLRQVRFDVMGQYAAAFRGDPVLAYKQKAFIFSRHHDEVFPPDVRVEEVLFEWTCGEICRGIVQKAVRERDEEDVRILRKGGTLFVLATMGRVASLRNGATYLKHLKEQNVSSARARVRLRRYAQYSLEKYVQAVIDQADNEKGEQATLIRQPEFYTKVLGRVERAYRTDSQGRKWLTEVLPIL